MYLISIYFDEHSNKILQSWISEIAKRTGNSFMTENQVPPHMTISAFEARTDADAVRVFDQICESLEGNTDCLQIVSTGAFLPYVIFVQAVLDQRLQDLSQLVYDCVCNGKDTRVSKMYRPFSWLPHITMGKKLEEEQMRIAFEILQKRFLPVTARIRAIGIAKPNPHRDLKVVEF